MNFTYQGQGEGEGGSETASQAPAAREHMFEKVVTPSDVGKLNRLVIPKQHAEKYFPLDPSSSDKGLLLNFEDRSGKPWRFRYSYWNSSQSYVMTKGWSRFVKDKKLDAGDVVSFLRASNDHRLFIDFRRRPDAPSLTPWGPFFLPTTNYYPNNYSSTTIVNGNPCPLLYLRDPSPALHHRNLVFDSVPVVQGKVVAAKRLRLFGVNMDCPIDDSENDNNNNNNINIVSSSSSSAAAAHHTELMMMPSSRYQSSSSSSSSSSSLARLRHSDDFDCKGKGSMSLDLDI